MSSFTVYGLNGHELMPVEQIFKGTVVEKTAAITGEQPVDGQEHLGSSVQRRRQSSAEQAYHAVEELPRRVSILLAEQVMTAPVVTLTPEARISEALTLFQDHGFRHVPVISSADRLVGIVSDRDILRFLAGVTGSIQQQAPHTADERVGKIMVPRVLTASVDTDIRYITRLFVEQRVGAVPITKEDKLEGIIARSDVLRAVMRHYRLEWWA